MSKPSLNVEQRNLLAVTLITFSTYEEAGNIYLHGQGTPSMPVCPAAC